MRKVGIIVISLALVLIGVVAFQRSKQGSEIKIGAIIPLTGFGAYWGDNTQKGMQMAADDLKKQGLQVQLFFEDSAGKPAQAASAAQKLISVNGVDALYSEFTGPSGAVSPIARNANKVLYYESFDPSFVKDNPYMLKTSLNIAKECSAIANYAKNHGIKKVSYVGPNLSLVKVCINELGGVLGENNVSAELAANTSETDFRSQLLNASRFGSKLIVALNYDTNNVGIFKQNKELGLNLQVFCDLADCYNDTVKKGVPASALENTIFVDEAVSPDFVSQFKNTYKDATDSDIKIAAQAYDAVIYLASGIKDCAKGDASCVVKDIVSNKSYSTKLLSSGFGDDRILNPTTFYFRLKSGTLESYSLK